jgi:prepilin-type N-terminal cleavage/methylation domain-containing protein
MRGKGLTLVEMLIAVALGAVLCLAGATLLIKSQRVYLQDEQLARLQENGHYALRLLSRELSMAGYFGEVLPGDIVAAPPAGTTFYQHLVQLNPVFEHYDNLSPAGVSAGGIALPQSCSRHGDHQAEADALLLRRTLDLPAMYRGEQHAPTFGDMLYLRLDRDGAALERGTTGSAVDASLWRFHPQLLFLRAYSRVRGDGIPALCRLRLSPMAARTAPVECLVEGVEQMQIGFGIDGDGDRRADRYVSTLAPGDVARAVVARIQLLVRSPLPLPGHRDNNTYTLGNTRYGPVGDGFLRRVLETSVLLRNSDVHRS